MKFQYRTKGTCSQQISLEIIDDKLHNVSFVGGCDGNLQAIPRLVEGMSCDEVIARLRGIRCGFKNTSCGDQLAQAVQLAREQEARQHENNA